MRLIKGGECVREDRSAWTEHQPSAEQENEFINARGYGPYARWHLGIDDAHQEHTKARYVFPYGDLTKVHRCGVLAAESRAGQHRHPDIERAAAHLHGRLNVSR